MSDYTAYLSGGHVVEFGETERMFTEAQNAETRAYLGGRTLAGALV